MAAKKTAKKTAPKTYKTLRALVKARMDGKLPRGFKLFIDNDNVAANGEAANFSMDPRDVMKQALALLGIKSQDI